MASIRTVRDLGATIRGRRHEQRWSQAELADRAGVSRSWLSEVETGKGTAEVGLVLAVLDALDVRLSVGPDAADTSTPAATPIDLDAHLERYRSR